MVKYEEGMMETGSSEKIADRIANIFLSPDTIYFLIEPAVKFFVDAIHIAVTRGQPEFEKIINMVGEKLHVLQ